MNEAHLPNHVLSGIEDHAPWDLFVRSNDLCDAVDCDQFDEEVLEDIEDLNQLAPGRWR